MITQLQVVFTGSCAFVPHTSGDRVRVLLPNGETSWQSHDKKVMVPGHRAFISFPLVHHEPGGRDPDFVFTSDAGRGEQIGVCLLVNEVLTLPTSTNGFYLVKGPLGGARVSTAATSASLDWVAQLDTEICTVAPLKRQYINLPSPSDPSALHLSAILDITDGRLETNYIRKETEYDFAPPACGPYTPRSLANEVVLRIDLKSPKSYVEILSSAASPLQLKPVAGQIRCQIGNEVLAELIMPDSERDNAAYDFELLFRLTDAPPGHVHIPNEKGGKLGKKVDCHGAFFKPSAFAP